MNAPWPRIYIMQNTMVGGGGKDLGVKMNEGKENGGKLHKKTLKKALKIYLFGLLKNLPRPLQFLAGKKLISKVGGGGGGLIEMHNIYPSLPWPEYGSSNLLRFFILHYFLPQFINF